MITLNEIAASSRPIATYMFGILGAILIGMTTVIDYRIAVGIVAVFVTIVLMLRVNTGVIVWLILLAYFNIFGLLPRDYLANFTGSIELRELVFALLMSLIIVVILDQNLQVWRSPLFWPTTILIGYIILRILITYLQWDTSLILALREGRKYFSYVLIWLPIVLLRSRRDIRIAIKALIISGAIIAFLIIVAQVVPSLARYIFNVAYAELRAYESALGIKVHYPGWPLVPLAFLLVFFRWAYIGRWKDIFLLLLLTIGVLVQKYRTMYLLLPLTVAIVFLLQRKRLKWNSMLPRLGLLVILVILLVLIAAPLLPTAFDKWINFVGRIPDEITGKVGGTFQGRLAQAAWRLELFLQHPWLGVGFIHKTEAMRLFQQPSISTTDIGYMDILVTGGVLLAMLILWLLASYLSQYRAAARETSYTDLWFLDAGLAFVLALALGVITFSFLSHDNGIVPLALVIGLTARLREMYRVDHTVGS